MKLLSQKSKKQKTIKKYGERLWKLVGIIKRQPMPSKPLRSKKKKKVSEKIFFKIMNAWDYVFKMLKKKTPTKYTLPSKSVLQKWERNKIFPRQTKCKGINHHYAGPTINV